METEKTGETPVTPALETETVESAVETGKDGKPFDAERAQKTIDQLRAEAKELKATKKRLEELEKAEQARKEAELTEVEKATKRAEQAEAEMKALKQKDMQRTAAEKIGLPSQFAERLQGQTPEELEADAKLLLDAMPKPSGKTNITNPGGQPAKETDEEKGRRLGLRR